MISAGDVQAGAITLWGSLGLAGTIGPLEAGRQSAPTGTYAVVTAKCQRQQHYTEGIPGAVYVGFWRLEIKVYAIGAAAADSGAKTAATNFDAQGLTVTGGSVLETYPADGYPQLTEDPKRKQGEDWWQGVMGWDLAITGTM